MAVRAPHGSSYSYEKMKARHKEAYGYLTRALQIDEAGHGEEKLRRLRREMFLARTVVEIFVGADSCLAVCRRACVRAVC